MMLQSLPGLNRVRLIKAVSWQYGGCRSFTLESRIGEQSERLILTESHADMSATKTKPSVSLIFVSKLALACRVVTEEL